MISGTGKGQIRDIYKNIDDIIFYYKALKNCLI